MIGAPLALLGLLAVAVPVLIHLLGKHQSRILRFPTLRFIPTSRLAPTRRRKISDWSLLLVRSAIVAVAALALSQPYFQIPGRAAATQSSHVNRAIVLDTSASVRGPVARDSARRAALAAANSGVSTVIETDDPRHGIRAALAWLDGRAGRREAVVISDFQSSSIDSAALARIPADVGISLTRVLGEPATVQADDRPAVFVGAADSAAVLAAWRAIGAAPPRDRNRRVAVIYRSAPEAAALMAQATRIDRPWMGAVIAGLKRDPTLRAAAYESQASDRPTSLETVVAGRGKVVVAGRVGEQLNLFLLDEPGSLASVALLRNLMSRAQPGESDATSLSDAALRALEREAPPGSRPPADLSDARWFWLLAIALLVVEALMRRRIRGATSQQPAADVVVEERAA